MTFKGRPVGVVLKEQGKKTLDYSKDYLKNKAINTVLNPIDELVNANIAEIVTTIGSFVIRSIRGKFQRSITFTIGLSYGDRWLEEALYGILYEYNNIKKKSRLELTNSNNYRDGSGLYYRLDEGSHSLKYRNYDILLVIQSTNTPAINGKYNTLKIYNIITYNLDPKFITLFENDMISHRNSLLKIKANSPTINVYKDYHESDGYTFWEKHDVIPKRKLNTIYLPGDTKKEIVKIINTFFASKEYYRKHGVAWNLKLLFEGPPGSGKDSITRMISSEWNRNLYYVAGGKSGKFIPNAITDTSSDISYPLFVISDIDKYPFLINDTEINLDESENNKTERVDYKLLFGSMINALDGILSGDGRVIVMTTNHINKFSPTFLRPSRVDRVFHIGYVTPEVFINYTYDFFQRQLPADIKLKRDDITVAELQSKAFFNKDITFEQFTGEYVQ